MRLRHLLAVGHADDALVAFGRDGDLSFRDLACRATALADAIEARGTGRWLLSCASSFDFAVALMALAETGSVAVLPPSLAPGAIEALGPDLTGVLLDAQVECPLGGTRLDPASVVPAPSPRDFRELDRDALLLELCTSGTTGDAKRMPKRVRHLEDELLALEELIGTRLTAHTRIFATVSHQHIYGLLFRLLWPLTTGRPFATETYLHAEELLPRMNESASVLLASTPAHLKRLAARGTLTAQRGAIREVVSSGGPLATDTALAIESALGFAPLEVFGSTETGGVATRRRSATEPEPAWAVMPTVEVQRTEHEQLAVTSAFVSVGDEIASGRTRFVMGDRVETLADEPGRFHLGLRADRVVKIAEKRLSLPEMEQHLLAHDWVEEAALLVLGAEGDGRVHAVIALTSGGRAALDADGRRATGVALAEHLAHHVHRVGLPRAWRYVPELPRNAQGKTSHALLAQLFDGQRAEHRAVQTLEVPTDLPALEGHFEGQPVVPGVVQLDWVMRAAQTELGIDVVPVGVEALKFKEALLPGQRFTLTVERGGAGKSLRFELADGARVFTSGRFLLEQS